MTKELLIKFLENNCSEEELRDILRWAKTDTSNQEAKEWIFDDWNSYNQTDRSGDDERFTAIFDKIQDQIGQAPDKTEEKKVSTFKLSSITIWMTRIAAIFLIPVLVFLFYTISENQLKLNQFTSLASDTIEVLAPIGSRTVVNLSDGTEVHLNYGSKLKYPRFFASGKREVRLSGEGFFKVAHNPEQPFVVKTGKINILALGTTFNVLAYPDDEIIATTLVEGKVVLKQVLSNDKTKDIGSMIPGQHVTYNLKTKAIASTSGKIEKYISWTEGKLIFDDTPITSVAEKLSRMFNVDIEIDENVKDYYYTVTFIDEPLFQILDLMAVATPIAYKATPRKKLPDGSFSKQKITIERK